MRCDKRSESFTFHTTESDPRTQNEPGKPRVTRQRLQDRFDDECKYSLKSSKEGVRTAQRRWTNLNLSSISLPPIHPHRVLRSGADKLSRTLNNVRTTFGSLSQVSYVSELVYVVGMICSVYMHSITSVVYFVHHLWFSERNISQKGGQNMLGVFVSSYRKATQNVSVSNFCICCIIILHVMEYVQQHWFQVGLYVIVSLLFSSVGKWQVTL
jgi:hypothetical protein